MTASHSSATAKTKTTSTPQIVVASSGFPISKRSRVEKSPETTHSKNRSHTRKHPPKAEHLLDFHETYKEIKSFGAQAFEKKQKRQYEDDMYEKLTGRKRKHQAVPLPILRGIRLKAQERESRQKQEEKEAGIVTHKSHKKTNRVKHLVGGDKKRQQYGPAPSIGFVSKGVLQLKRKPK